MEEKSSHNEDEKQLALKSLLFCDGEEHLVQHDDDSKVKLNENEANTDHAKAHDSSPRRSPDPNCAICLGTLENKSFTDSCFHTFCFTCLVEWSKVKAECPLCKQSFKSIVHNVRSIEDYDQYYISSKSTDTSWRAVDGRSFRYRSTLTSERWTERHRYGAFEDSIEYRTHRMTYAPHSMTYPTVRNLTSEHPSTSSYRRHIYENGLWVKPLGDGNTQKYRITSPEFYRQNQACTHRLTPWLNRELLALLYDSESQVTFVLELILALIMRYDIRSEEFYVHIEPYLQHRTSHFIHEFFNFASSLHDMHTYDNCAGYEKLESISENSTDALSPGCDVVAIAAPSITISVTSPSSNEVQDLSSSDLSKRKAKKSSKRQPKLFLRRNQESNVWHSVLPTSSQSLNSTSSGNFSSDHAVSSSFPEFLDLGVVSGPSTSGLQIAAAQSKNTAANSFPHENVTSGSSSDTNDDCIVVDIVKPRALRTPELVNLVSSSEDERTLDNDNVHNNCVTTQGSTDSSKRKELEEALRVRGSKKKLKLHRKGSISSSSTVKEFSNCENLISTVQSPISPPPHDQGILPSVPVSLCKTYIESDETHNVNKPTNFQELFLCQDILDSPPQSAHKRHISYSSSSTECSQNACESGKTYGTNKNFSKIPSSGEELPSSISSFITQTYNKNDDPSSSVICTKQGSEFMLNHKTLPLTFNEENRNGKSDVRWQHSISSCGSSAEENAAFELGETKGKLRSVICQIPANEQQNSRSDSSHHSSSRNKKHKHKKKKKHGKHKHKHSHVSD